jgi:hypothetical protein
LTFWRRWEEFEIAHLAFRRYRNRIIFIPHGVKAPEFNPFNTGLSFFVSKIQISKTSSLKLSYGGKQRMPIREYYPKDKPFKMCYVEDPFGIVFEIYTHSYELTYSSGAYTK